MAYRTTDAAVREIIDTDVSSPEMVAAIGFANELVTECCTGTTSSGVMLSDTRLEMIERLLAAHFLCLKEFRAKSEKADVVSESKDTMLDLYFAHTHHGQMAVMLDTTGGLLALQKKAEDPNRLRQIIGAHYLGIEDEEELERLELD